MTFSVVVPITVVNSIGALMPKKLIEWKRVVVISTHFWIHNFIFTDWLDARLHIRPAGLSTPSFNARLLRDLDSNQDFRVQSAA